MEDGHLIDQTYQSVPDLDQGPVLTRAGQKEPVSAPNQDLRKKTKKMIILISRKFIFEFCKSCLFNQGPVRIQQQKATVLAPVQISTPTSVHQAQ